MYPFTPARIFILLLFYGALFIIISMHRVRLTEAERRTFILLGVSGAIIAFVSNYLLYRLGVMSFLPWINNALHTFIWIGIGFPYLFLGTRENQSLVVQFILFLTFSVIVKYAEQLLFGTWEFEHFFYVFRGNFAYIVGWSAVDGLYPVLVPMGLRMAGRFVPGVVLA